MIFDKVQECPNIISSLKYFCQDYREIPVIATGSMVRIKIQKETHKRGLADNGQFLFPVGKINEITVYRYLFVGGIPKTVDIYLDGENLFESRQALESLYDTYLSDMELYQESQETILHSRVLFSNIFKELNKESKNFSHHNRFECAIKVSKTTMDTVQNKSYQHYLFIVYCKRAC